MTVVKTTGCDPITIDTYSQLDLGAWWLIRLLIPVLSRLPLAFGQDLLATELPKPLRLWRVGGAVLSLLKRVGGDKGWLNGKQGWALVKAEAEGWGVGDRPCTNVFSFLKA